MQGNNYTPIYFCEVREAKVRRPELLGGKGYMIGMGWVEGASVLCRRHGNLG